MGEEDRAYEKEMKTIYYTPIVLKAMSKTGKWNKFGGNACTTMSDTKDGTGLVVEVEQYGKTEDEAKSKLLNFLTSGGKNEIKEI